MMRKYTSPLLLILTTFLIFSLASCTSSISEEKENIADQKSVVSEDVIEEEVIEEVAELKPAEFKVESLTVSPTEVMTYQKCTVTVDVTNIGEVKGIYL